MKSKNVARLFIFVFFLCFVFLCQGWSQEWKIPRSIIEVKYPETEIPDDNDWKDLKKDLNHRANKFKDDIKDRYHQRKWKAIAKKLKNHNVTVLFRDNGDVIKSELFKRFFEENGPDYKINITFVDVGGTWVDFEGTMGEIKFDIIASIKFTIVFTPNIPTSSDSGSPPDPFTLEGDTTSFHRRICTWF